jgi:hypothetical protein
MEHLERRVRALEARLGWQHQTSQLEGVNALEERVGLMEAHLGWSMPKAPPFGLRLVIGDAAATVLFRDAPAPVTVGAMPEIDRDSVVELFARHVYASLKQAGSLDI